MSIKPKITKEVKELLEKHSGGIHLDLGCGANKNEGFVGMDVRKLPGVDIVHNIEQFPYPLPDESCSMVVASHVLEHITPMSTDPRLSGLIDLLLKKKVLTKKEIEDAIGDHHVFGTFMTLMDEIWRILKPGGKFAFVVPYAGSAGFYQDPTHINPISEATPFYFDPTHPSGLWRIYKPKPWAIELNTFEAGGNLEVILKKREDNYE